MEKILKNALYILLYAGRFITMIFYHRFKVIKTCKIAEDKSLTFDRNVYGDEINMWNCRSFYYDKYGFMYRCAELHS